MNAYSIIAWSQRTTNVFTGSTIAWLVVWLGQAMQDKTVEEWLIQYSPFMTIMFICPRGPYSKSTKVKVPIVVPYHLDTLFIHIEKACQERRGLVRMLWPLLRWIALPMCQLSCGSPSRFDGAPHPRSEMFSELFFEYFYLIIYK